VRQRVSNQVHHGTSIPYSVLYVWNSRPTPYSMAISDPISTLHVLTRQRVGKNVVLIGICDLLVVVHLRMLWHTCSIISVTAFNFFNGVDFLIAIDFCVNTRISTLIQNLQIKWKSKMRFAENVYELLPWHSQPPPFARFATAAAYDRASTMSRPLEWVPAAGLEATLPLTTTLLAPPFIPFGRAQPSASDTQQCLQKKATNDNN